MKFRTECFPLEWKVKIEPYHKILTIGSCFSQNIGNLLSDCGFNTLINPFGTVFNPYSISKLLQYSLQNNHILKSDIDQDNERYFHHDFHSSFNSNNPEITIKSINQYIDETHAYIQNADFLILTLGTSFVYEHQVKKCIVSNCHKVSNQLFFKKFLTAIETEKYFTSTFNELFKINPKIKIIFTVSPVRHIKDGIVENTFSKSSLLVAVNNLCSLFDQATYFPAYELMMDDLRDYRFYKEDMIHPTDQAIDYIFEKFIETTFSENSKTTVLRFKAENKKNKHKTISNN